MPDWLELVRVQLPGREERADEAPIVDLEELVSVLAPQVAAICDRPFIVYGHCVGALIAFELCHALQANGLGGRLAGLFVSGRRAPQVPSKRKLYNVSEDELVEALREMGAESPLLSNARWRRYYLEIMRADLALTDTYVYRPRAPLPCALHYIWGKNDVHFEEAGWPEQTSEQYRCHIVEGGHFLAKSGVERIMGLMRTALPRSAQPDAAMAN
jgi:medium-chain acyl-[acyl-carrier-protein] hydrolase